MIRLLLWLWRALLRLLGGGHHDREPRPVDPVSLLQQEIHALRAQVDSRLGDLQTTLSAAQERADTRLLDSSRAIGDVKEGLGKLEGATARILEVGQGVARLEEVLRPPQLRGALGEFLLEEIIAQVLPRELYQMQYRFQGGETVDAIIRLPAGTLPVDAKFPLDAFRDMVATEDEAERRRRRRDFEGAVRRQVEEIASKYIRPDEETLDLALMYIPAENVYYEVVLRHQDGPGLLEHCLRHRVFPVSPLSFYAHLQALAIGLRGMRMEENARSVLGMLSRLRSDLDSFEGDFRVLGTHLRNAYNKFQEAQGTLGAFSGRLDRVEGLPAASERPPLPPHEEP